MSKKMKKQESIGRLISCIYRYSQFNIAKKLCFYNIGRGQISFLMSLYNCDGVSQENMAKKLRIDKSTAARAVKKLINKGYIIKERDLSDKRKYKVFLTEKAKKIKPKITKIVSEWSEALLSDFTDEERKILIKFLKKIIKNADQ
jgi:DNA-binding MarR family transcriptional regulator